MIYAYPGEFVTDDDGTLVVTFPDVPEAVTGGQDRTEALRLAADALAVALAGYVHDRRDIPEPSSTAEDQELVAVPAVAAAKLALYSAMRAQRISKSELARRLRVERFRSREADRPRPAVQHLASPGGTRRGRPQPDNRGDHLSRPHPVREGGPARNRHHPAGQPHRRLRVHPRRAGPELRSAGGCGRLPGPRPLPGHPPIYGHLLSTLDRQ